MVINYQKIYEKLGYLFYAIAAADNKVTPAEIARLMEMVKRYWVPVENSTDEFGTDAAHYIAISFDYLVDEGISSEEAFGVFKAYYNEHSGAFSKDIRRTIKTTVTAMATDLKADDHKKPVVLSEINNLLK